MSNKIGFWSVFELVTVCQIGSGLMLPANLAAYGTLSFWGWGASSLGAILLAFMFSQLCLRYPRTGGPHAYVKEAFGKTAGFFTGWTYWVISWVSTIAIITSAVGYVLPILGVKSPFMCLALEIIIIVAVTVINLQGVYRAGKSKLLFNTVKMLPFIVVPFIALSYFDFGNLAVLTITKSEQSQYFNYVVLLTFWGFIGFETVTASVAEIDQPQKTIPRAILFGTLFVAAVYFLSSVGIMGAVPAQILMYSNAPYAETIHYLFGGYWHLIISIIAALVCLAAVNAWTLASGQIALGIAQDKLLPKIFAKQNKNGAPVAALTLSCLGSIPVLILAHTENIAEKVNIIIDFSVVAFVFVYVISCVAFLKLMWKRRSEEPAWLWICGVLSLCFCLWIVASTDLAVLLVASFFVLSGLPIYWIMRKRRKPDMDAVPPSVMPA